MRHFLAVAVLAASPLAACNRADTPSASTSASAATSTLVANPATALASAVRLLVLGCTAEAVRGAGSMLEGGFVLTAAHVVSGASDIRVWSASRDGSGAAQAHLMAIDPVNDLALLSVPQLTLPELRVSQAGAGDHGLAVIFRDEAPLAQPFTITKPVVVNILDIHQAHKISRPGYLVNIDIAAGDSGSVMIGPENTAVGLLYAKSREADNRAFASDLSALPALIGQTGGVNPALGIPTGDCV